MSVRYRNHEDPIRERAQVTGDNVVPFNPRAPWPCEEKAEAPEFLKREPRREDQ